MAFSERPARNPEMAQTTGNPPPAGAEEQTYQSVSPMWELATMVFLGVSIAVLEKCWMTNCKEPCLTRDWKCRGFMEREALSYR